jgi:repressor of nif and glnA expression
MLSIAVFWDNDMLTASNSKKAGLFESEDMEKKTLLILRILSESRKPVGSRSISRHMNEMGVKLSERTIRYHLRVMDERGFTRLVGRRNGRVITDEGREEIRNARVQDKIGFVISRIENLAFCTTFDPVSKKGLVPVNISYFEKERFREALDIMLPVFKSRYSVSEFVTVAKEGQTIGGILVPPGKIAVATVCSIIINGVFLKSGIPMDSKFGGILQISDSRPLRFVELIYYNGTSLDPSEAFIRANMTSVGKAVETGFGNVLANYREIPGMCRMLTGTILIHLRKAGINGVIAIGEKSETVYPVPVDVNKAGVVLIGGLNPVACAREAGLEPEHHAMSTLLEYENFINIEDVKRSL